MNSEPLYVQGPSFQLLAAPDEPRTELSSIAWPLAGSFFVTGWALMLVCRFELASTLSLRALIVFPLVCMALTAGLHALTIWVARGILGRAEPEALPLMHSTWTPIVWMPSLVVLGMDRSMWVAVMLPLMSGLTTVLLHRWSAKVEEQGFADDVQSLFRSPMRARLRLRETLFPALLVSIAAQAGVVALVARRDWVAGCLLAVASLLPVWRFPRRQNRYVETRRGESVASSVAALLVLEIALVPFLKPGPGHAALEALLNLKEKGARAASVHAGSTAAGYSGIILVMPKKPHEEVVAPKPSAAPASTKGKPLTIKFDGAYWYFKEIDDRPRPDAQVVQGDPLKAKIRSTTQMALLMEAHQPLMPALPLDCCSAVEVNVVNGEVRGGGIYIEVLLGDSAAKDKPAVSLGLLAVRSSIGDDIDLMRAPVHETLKFPIPASASGRQADEITVRIKRNGEQALAGSRVSVESFVLVP